eukprot:1258522-Rhodomonas_salina.1
MHSAADEAKRGRMRRGGRRTLRKEDSEEGSDSGGEGTLREGGKGVRPSGASSVSSSLTSSAALRALRAGA